MFLLLYASQYLDRPVGADGLLIYSIPRLFNSDFLLLTGYTSLSLSLCTFIDMVDLIRTYIWTYGCIYVCMHACVYVPMYVLCMCQNACASIVMPASQPASQSQVPCL